MNAQLMRADRIKSVPQPENRLYGVLQWLFARLFPEARKKMRPVENYQQATETCKEKPNPSLREILGIELPEEYEQPSDIEVYVLLLNLNNPNCCLT